MGTCSASCRALLRRVLRTQDDAAERRRKLFCVPVSVVC
eukprot:gene2901-15174_t